MATTSENFTEAALKLGGKSDEEAHRIGAVDTADEQVEKFFSPEYQTIHSPLHRAVWDRHTPIELFEAVQRSASPQATRVMHDSLEIVRNHVEEGTVYDPAGKIDERVIGELADAGYWGLLVDEHYGGAGAPFSQFAPFLTRMATLEPTVAGLASVHGCIGAVDPVQTFGTREQKASFLPQLAGGKRLSAFALTEPCAGSDLTALRTTAHREGESYRIRGEKLFITNVRPGGILGLVCLVEGRPAVFVAELPQEENEHFRLRCYGLYALRHAHNYGIIFRDFRIPADNLLQPPIGDGLTIAYHGLNRGRVSLCACAAGALRLMLADTIPWVRFRRTYGQPIGNRELVERRIGRLAGLTTACDALTLWTAGLLDRGYRGEMECIIAKIFASEVQKEAAIELYMKTHGGRAFLRGHGFGDNVHDFLAPCIYEGEGEMLGMALFKSLVKQHAREHFEPIGKVLQHKGIRRPDLRNPKHLWALKGPLWSYTRWWGRQTVKPPRYGALPPMPAGLKAHAHFAADWLSGAWHEISGMMRKHGLNLADRQCRIAELSGRIQTATVILVTSLCAARQEEEVVRMSADCLCGELTRRLTGRRATDRELRALVETGAAVLEGGFPMLAGIPRPHILMPYSNQIDTDEV